jgi:AAA domain
MKLRLRGVRLRVHTADGALSRTVRFEPGFNVIRGRNSSGKTQVIQAVIYALGLERMLQARANAPLGSALTSEVRTADDDEAPGQPVDTSWVAVELENRNGRIITAQRHVRHERLQPNLVRVWYGPALTDPESAGVPDELFLHLPGSASRDLGFHKLLSDMLEWSLPQVATYTGASTTLYPDVVFPFLIVDQQSWGSAGPRKVERYQIREPVRRSAEFLLSLAGPVAEARRAELDQSLAALRTRWAAARSAVNTLAGTVGGRIVGVPEHAAGAHARAATPAPTQLGDAELQLLEDGEWISSYAVIAHLSDQLQEAEAAGERRIAAGVDEQTQRELDEARTQLADLVAASRLMEQDLSMGEAQLAALDRRLSMLHEERDRNADIRTLMRLGSRAAASHMADHNCPTCRQSLDAVEANDLGPVLDVDETVSLLNAQIATTQKMRDRAQAVVGQTSNAYAAMQRKADQLRTTAKALEADVLAPADALSTGEVARRVTLQLRHDELLRTRASLDERFDELADLAQRIATVRTELSSLPIGVPRTDTERLSEVTSLMRQRLTATRFGSYDVREVGLDQDALRPSRAGFDVDTDVSASDVVRIKVAYLDAVRVTGQTSGRHPGLLVLDEPRQQDIDPVDYAAMLQYLANSTDDGGQIIITSATPRGELDQMISSASAHVADMDEARLLQPDSASDPLDPD